VPLCPHAGRPGRDDAINGVLDAMQRLAPEVLRDLQRLEVCTWTKTYHLEEASPYVMEKFRALRDWWAKHPHAAADLRCGAWIDLVGSVLSPADEAWVRAEAHAKNLPNPLSETLAQWLARARRLYKDRDAACGRAYRPYQRWKQFQRHCDWFVDVQVLGTRPATLATRLKVDRVAIERETKKIAARLGVARRTWPRGRRRHTH
jgi:hypothetical protein